MRGSRKWLTATMEIAKGYNAFNNDSALHYYTIGANTAAARELHDLENEFLMRRATYLTISGYTHDALSDIERIDTAALSPQLMSTYYAATRQMYSYISSYYDGRNVHYDHWHRLALEAQHRLLPTLPPESNIYRLNLGEYSFLHGELARASQVLTSLLNDTNPDDDTYAVACHILSQIARSQRRHKRSHPLSGPIGNFRHKACHTRSHIHPGTRRTALRAWRHRPCPQLFIGGHR